VELETIVPAVTLLGAVAAAESGANAIGIAVRSTAKVANLSLLELRPDGELLPQGLTLSTVNG
jgi:hypothetical protein